MRNASIIGILLLTLAALLPAAPPARAAAAPGGPDAEGAAAAGVTVSGEVNDPAGRPVAGALVQVLNHEGLVTGTGTTNPQGRFQVSADLDPDALFRVQVWAEGYRRAVSPWQGAWDSRQPSISLAPFGGELSGQVLGANDLPAPGATVELRSPDGRLQRQITADETGRFALTASPGDWVLTGAVAGLPLAEESVTVRDGSSYVVNLQPAPHQVRITGQVVEAETERPVGATQVEVHRLGWGIITTAPVAAADGRFEIEVPPTEEPEYVLRAWPPGYQSVETEPFAAPEGEELDFTGSRALAVTPLNAAIVGVLAEDDGDTLDYEEIWVEREGLGIVASTQTDNEGRFEFKDLPAGEGIRYRVRTAPSLHRVTGSSWLTLRGGEVRPLALVAPPLTSVHTAPERVLVVGRVTDPSGQPVSGAEVVVNREGYGREEVETVNAQGLFRFRLWATRDGEGTGPGYRIRVQSDRHYATTEVEGAEGGILHFGPGESILLNVVLTPRHRALTGRVVDAEGKPVAGASVRLVRDGFQVVAGTTTGPDGRYQFPRVPVAGYPAYKVVAAAAGYFSASLPDLTDADQSGPRPDLVLRPNTAAISGRVTDLSGLPLSGVRVEASFLGSPDPTTGTAANGEGEGEGDGASADPEPAGPPAAVTDAQGRWELAGLPAGMPIRLTFTASDRFPHSSGPIQLTPGATAERDVTLLPSTACLSGRVVVPAGEDPGAVTVRLFRDGAGLVASTTTDAGGRYRFEGQPTDEGWYWLYAEAAGYQPALPSTALFPLMPRVTGSCQHRNLVLIPVME